MDHCPFLSVHGRVTPVPPPRQHALSRSPTADERRAVHVDHLPFSLAPGKVTPVPAPRQRLSKPLTVGERNVMDLPSPSPVPRSHQSLFHDWHRRHLRRSRSRALWILCCIHPLFGGSDRFPLLRGRRGHCHRSHTCQDLQPCRRWRLPAPESLAWSQRTFNCDDSWSRNKESSSQSRPQTWSVVIKTDHESEGTDHDGKSTAPAEPGSKRKQYLRD